MLVFLACLLGREEPCGKQAKELLRLALVHDLASISPHLLDTLRVDLIEVLSKYVEIDEDALEVNLERDSDAIALVANIPIRRMKPSTATRSVT